MEKMDNFFSCSNNSLRKVSQFLKSIAGCTAHWLYRLPSCEAA